MVVLFSERKNKIEREIIEILIKHSGDYISDKEVFSRGGKFTVISEYKRADIKMINGIAIIIDETSRFEGQIFKEGTIGICESTNKSALTIFEKSKIPIISCGNNPKNTITFSSINDDSVLLSLQRNITSFDGEEIFPCELNIKLTKKYQPFSIMASTTALLLCGIIPEEF